VDIGELTVTASPFFEGAGRPSRPYWGPQQGRKVVLWESLGPEDQKKCLIELRNDTNWVIWCKSKPKGMAAQTFREYGRCIFEGKRAKPKLANDNQEEMSGGRHVTRARSWWKRSCRRVWQCCVHQGIILNDEQAETNLREAWEHESSKDEMNIVIQGLEQHFWRGTDSGWIGC
jgi:hypothetical protein